MSQKMSKEKYIRKCKPQVRYINVITFCVFVYNNSNNSNQNGNENVSKQFSTLLHVYDVALIYVYMKVSGLLEYIKQNTTEEMDEQKIVNLNYIIIRVE